MKPAAFSYHGPRTIEETVGLLARYGDECKILAGGQSLVPTMRYRLAKPAVLVDINEVANAAGASCTAGFLEIAALTRHAAFHRDAVAPPPLGPLLRQVAGHIAHRPIRERGTFGGSLAHADPASEWCLVATTFDAVLNVQSRRGRREVPADAFFLDALAPDLAADELLTSIRLPLLPAEWTTGFCEVSRRAGDFALAMAAVALRIVDGTIVAAHLGVGGVSDRPYRLQDVETALIGHPADADRLASAARDAPRAASLADSDILRSPYRRDLLSAVLRRALREAAGLPVEIGAETGIHA